jgi:hypothetical protein
MKWSELVQGPPLRWVTPSSLKMNYQLVHGDEVITKMRFESSFGSLATVVNTDGCWTFKRMGFVHPTATIRPCGSETEIATFRSNTWKGGGTLELPSGRHIHAATNFWQTRLEFQETSGEILIQLKYDNVWCTSATVGIHAAALSAPETTWMVALGWYLMVMSQVDAGSSLAVAGASS